MSTRTLCKVIGKEFSSLIRHGSRIQQAFINPRASFAQKTTYKLTARAIQGVTRIETIVDSYYAKSIGKLPVMSYMSFLETIRRNAARSSTIPERHPEAFSSWTDYFEGRKTSFKAVRFRVKATDLVGAALTAWFGYDLAREGHNVNPQLATATALWLYDFIYTKGRPDSPARIGAFTAGTLPFIQSAANYFTGNNFQYEEMKEMFLVPASTFAFSLAPTEINAKLRGFSAKDYVEAGRLAGAKNVIGNFFERTRNMAYTLQEIRRVQLLTANIDDVAPALIEDFENACIDYLQGNGKKESLRLTRKNIKDYIMRRHYDRPDVVAAVQMVNGDISKVSGDESVGLLARLTQRLEIEQPSDSGFRVLDVREPYVSPETTKSMEFVASYGVAEKLARRIATVTSFEHAQGIQQRLEAIVGPDHVNVIKANPFILAMDREISERYFGSLVGTMERISALYGQQVPDNLSVARNPAAFSTLDGIAGINMNLDRISSPQVREADPLEAKYSGLLRTEGYDNFGLLRAILIDGFRLNAKRPRVGMAYSEFHFIRRETRPAVNQRDMEHFDVVFGQLIADGVILADKSMKSQGGGGKFPGCYSLNPRVEEIKKPKLRAFVADCMYSKLRSGNGNGSGK